MRTMEQAEYAARGARPRSAEEQRPTNAIEEA